MAPRTDGARLRVEYTYLQKVVHCDLASLCALERGLVCVAAVWELNDTAREEKRSLEATIHL